MKIYIAGKITGLDPAEARKKFDETEEMLHILGHEAVNPMAKVSEQEGFSWVEYMKEDIPLLLGCDAVYLQPDWQDSKGARLEKLIAEGLEMKLIFEHRRPDGSMHWSTPSSRTRSGQPREINAHVDSLPRPSKAVFQR